MEAKDLKYKNYVSYKGEEWQINDIFGASGLINLLPREGTGTPGRLSVLEIEPIELNEEWLIRLGLRPHNNPGSSFLHWSFKDTEEFTNTLWSNGDAIYLEYFGTPVEYVHSLQNLFYSLTGQELK